MPVSQYKMVYLKVEVSPKTKHSFNFKFIQQIFTILFSIVYLRLCVKFLFDSCGADTAGTHVFVARTLPVSAIVRFCVVLGCKLVVAGIVVMTGTGVVVVGTVVVVVTVVGMGVVVVVVGTVVVGVVGSVVVVVCTTR